MDRFKTSLSATLLGMLLASSCSDTGAQAQAFGRVGAVNQEATGTPPGGAPVFISISVSDTTADMSARNAAVADIGGAVMKMVTARP